MRFLSEGGYVTNVVDGKVNFYGRVERSQRGEAVKGSGDPCGMVPVRHAGTLAGIVGLDWTVQGFGGCCISAPSICMANCDNVVRR
jgi:hypothetical protein